MDRKLQGNKIKVTSLDGYKGTISMQTTRTLAEGNTLPSWPMTNYNQIKFGSNATSDEQHAKRADFTCVAYKHAAFVRLTGNRKSDS